MKYKALPNTNITDNSIFDLVWPFPSKKSLETPNSLFYCFLEAQDFIYALHSMQSFKDVLKHSERSQCKYGV